MGQNNKRVDGISKLSPDDLKKSRNIVLKYIGELDKPSGDKKVKEAKVKTGEQFKQVDGLIMSRRPGQALDVQALAKPRSESASKDKPEGKAIKTEPARSGPQLQPSFADRKQLAGRPAAEPLASAAAAVKLFKTSQPPSALKFRPSAPAEPARPEIQLREGGARRILTEKKRQEEQRLQRRKTVAAGQTREGKQSLAAEAAKRTKLAKENKRREQEKNSKKQLRQRKKKIKIYKNKLKRFVSLAWPLLAASFKRSFRIFSFSGLIFFALLIVAYAGFASLLLFFHYDSRTSRLIADALPVPALVTNFGLVEYYDYQDAKQRKLNQDTSGGAVSSSPAQIVAQLEQDYVKNFIIEKLSNKYNVTAEQVAERLVLDREINQANIARAEKLVQLIKKGEDFDILMTKYGDQYERGKYYNSTEAEALFGPAILNLSPGQTSGILARPGGYYIVNFFDRQGSLSGFKFAFIKAKTLEQYLDEQLANVRTWNLAE